MGTYTKTKSKIQANEMKVLRLIMGNESGQSEERKCEGGVGGEHNGVCGERTVEVI